MDNPYHSQTQFELFPSAGRATPTRQQPRLFNSPLTFSMENFIILTIVIVMSMILSFSFGVERGKKNEPSAASPAVSTVPRSVAPVALQEPPPVSASIPAATEKAAAATADPAAAETAAAAVVAPPSEKTVDNFYTVQVASYKIGDYAKKEAMGLKQKEYDSMVLTKGQHEIVCVGKFAAMNEAKKFLQKLKKQYKDCLVRRM